MDILFMRGMPLRTKTLEDIIADAEKHLEQNPGRHVDNEFAVVRDGRIYCAKTNVPIMESISPLAVACYVPRLIWSSLDPIELLAAEVEIAISNIEC